MVSKLQLARSSVCLIVCAKRTVFPDDHSV